MSFPITDVGEAALAALAVAFEQIGTGTETDWAQNKTPQVLRERIFDRIPPSRPIIVLPGVIENCLRDTATNPARYKSTASIPVRVHFDAQTWNPAVDASTWKHDLKKAVGLSHTLTGTAFDLTIVSIITGLPSPDQDQSVRIAMDLSLEWFWSENDPATAIP
jgi:hypothetical protein